MSSDRLEKELKRVKRVADTLCTAHAGMRDRLENRALILDLLIMGFSVWMVGLAFIDPAISIAITPFDWDSKVWIGVLSIFTFFLTIVQFKTDWKGRSDAHRHTFDLYAEVKRDANYLLASQNITEDACKRIFERYDLASAVGIGIPERDFLKMKQRHWMKVEQSRYLDSHPAASLTLFRIRLWCRDNLKVHRNESP